MFANCIPVLPYCCVCQASCRHRCYQCTIPYVITPLITCYTKGSQMAKILLFTMAASAFCSEYTKEVCSCLLHLSIPSAVLGNVHFCFDERDWILKKNNLLSFLLPRVISDCGCILWSSYAWRRAEVFWKKPSSAHSCQAQCKFLKPTASHWIFISATVS